MKKNTHEIFVKARTKLPDLFGTDSYGICKQSDFHKWIDLERNRVHRHNQQFSLILFDVDSRQNKKIPEKLIKKLSERIRRIDRIGWYDDLHIGVLLPNTSPQEAKYIAKDICGHQDPAFGFFPFATLSYPNKVKTAF